MPRINNIPGPYHIYFVSFDCAEPPHVHVARERYEAKFWLQPVELAHNYGYRQAELKRIERILVEHRLRILEAWHEHCNPSNN
ncbi:MAG: DUF4160 domain-containing protein [Caldilineaceae bacterium]|nr:DUF4160 domain-containing protein [Caldilineaceae bacterium]